MTAPAQTRSLYPWLMKEYLALANDFSNNRLHHAVLICGASGLGKHQLIERLTQLIQCQQPLEHKACGQCQDCQLHQSQSHADYYHVSQLDGKAQVSIDQIRQLSKSILSTGLVNQRRVVVIEPLNGLTESAANALLKILEEPPKHVYFLLSTASNQHVPATIMSRCFKLQIKLPQASKILQWLERKSGTAISEHQLDLLGATPLRALQGIESGLYLELQQLISLLNQLYLSWGTRNINQGFSATLAIVEHIDKLIMNSDMQISIDETLSIIQRFNQQALKSQFVNSNVVDNDEVVNNQRASNEFINKSLISSAKNIPSAQLLDFSSRLTTLKRLLSNNNGLNMTMQIQRCLSQMSQDMTDNKGMRA